MSKLTHTDQQGKANMVDVSFKKDQLRVARAEGMIHLEEDTLRLVNENSLKKGDVMTVAQIAGIQAAKQTSSLIPLCHPISITKVEVRMEIIPAGIKASSEVHCVGPTGVEMEALTAVTVSLLTVYDMCKAVDKNMTLYAIRLLEKTKTDI
ncbi:MAG: cyclic pyranopterin monophosphate synthase MoaC [Bacteroidetes bacterium]|nr:cyclic pyranopterin monophosphate synthase MoaC [Bacteroidota bacterium]